MTVQASDAVHTAALNVVESTIGTEPVLKLFSGAVPANCAAADPSGLLCTLVLPADWLAGAFGVEKEQNGGPWVGIATASGTIASFRLYSSGGTCHAQGTVGRRTTSADLKLLNTVLMSGQKVKISKFRLFNVMLTVPHPVIGGTLNKTQDSQTLVARGTAPVVQPQPDPVIGGRVEWNDTEPADGPTYDYAHSGLKIWWKRGVASRVPIDANNGYNVPQPVGGDWLDKNGTPNGLVPYATIPASTFNGVAKWVTVTGLAALATKMLEDNTAIFVHPVGTQSGIPAQFCSREHTSNFPAIFRITTNTGTFACTVTADTYLEPTSNATQGTVVALRVPFILKFDLSAVSGTVTAAQLEVRYIAYGGQALAVDYLDMPLLITDPMVQLPTRVEYGIANDVSRDQALADHPSVLLYVEMKDLETVSSSFQWGSGGADSFHGWADYGLTAAGTWNGPPRLNTAMNRRSLWVNRPTGIVNRLPWEMDFSEAPEHLFLRYVLYLDTNVATRVGSSWSNWQGTKLPGLQGITGNYPDASQSGGQTWVADGFNPEGVDDGLYSMPEHHTPSLANNRAMALTLYCYDEDRRWGDFFGNGRIEPTGGYCWRVGKHYVVEQEIQLNTITNGIPDRNGITRLWFDGVKVLERTDRVFRTYDEQRIFSGDMLIMHGGNGIPLARQDYQISAWCIATQYIGPPRKVPSWRQGLTTNTFHAVNGTAAMSSVTSSSPTINTWNGLAASDLKLFAALNGGHADSAENKVYELDLQDDAPVWVKLSDGTANPTTQTFDVSHYSDGKPASRHTYYTLQYASNLNSVLAVTGYALWGTGGGATTSVDAFALGSNAWVAADTFTDSPFVAYNGVTAVCRDHRSDKIYVAGSFGGTNRFYEFNPSGLTGQQSGVWTSLISGTAAVGLGEWQYHGTCIDVDQDRWVCLYSTGPTLRWIALDGSSSGSITVTGQLATDGVTQYSQIVYDEDNDRYVAITGTGKVYAITTAGASTLIATTTAPAVSAVCGRFHYFPKLGGIAYQPTFASPLLFMPTRS